jgi:hypothetical protein
MARQPKRHWRRYSLRGLLFLIIMALVAWGLVKWPFHASPSPYHTLPEILSRYPGWELVQGPDRPGPYETIGAPSSTSGIGGGVSGSFWAHGEAARKYNIPGIPGYELCAVGLVPQGGGGPTYVVLKRKPSRNQVGNTAK